MSKTPFEIRMELLKLARDLESERTHLENKKLEEEWYIQRELHLVSPTPSDPGPYPEMETIRTSKILSIAKELNDFVSTKE